MNILLYILSAVAVIASACDQKKKIINSRRYSVEVNTWGFGGPSFAAFMYNTGPETYPLERRGKSQFEENTLYILKHKRSDDQTLTDTLKISLSGEEIDSLYELTHRFVSDFQIDNRVEVGKPIVKMTDGASLKVALGFDGKLMECWQYHLEGVGLSSAGGRELIVFINRRAPKEFWLY